MVTKWVVGQEVIVAGGDFVGQSVGYLLPPVPPEGGILTVGFRVRERSAWLRRGITGHNAREMSDLEWGWHCTPKMLTPTGGHYQPAPSLREAPLLEDA